MEFLEKILMILFIVLILGLFTWYCIDDSKYIYKCTDTQGNIVYCESAEVNRGGMFGITEDGTRLVITSYKRVLKEEVNK